MEDDFLIESNHQIETAEDVKNDTEQIIETTTSEKQIYVNTQEIDAENSSTVNTISEDRTIEIPKSEVTLSTFEILADNAEIYGVSLKGRQHTENNEQCQDYHLFRSEEHTSELQSR